MSTSIRTRQSPLFVESLEDALEAVAMACGGKKAFACLLRPDLSEDPDKAHRWFLDALNPDRRTEIHAEHLRRACIVARKNDCHILKHWFDEVTGYEPGQPAPGKTPEQVLAGQLQQALAEVQRITNEMAASRA